MDRRTSIKWVLAAAASVPALQMSFAGDAAAREVAPNQAGYGSDPDLLKEWKAGGPWPLTLSENARATAKALGDLIIPADESSPAASAVGVVDFIDEWISAPYPQQRADREVVLPGLLWIEAESQRRFKRAFPEITAAQRAAIADDVCSPASAKPGFEAGARFFAKFRDLTAGGFYTTPIGMKAIGYTGNVPLENFAGPPPEALKKAGVG